MSPMPLYLSTAKLSNAMYLIYAINASRFGLLVGHHIASSCNHALHIRQHTHDGQAHIKQKTGLRGDYEEGLCTFTVVPQKLTQKPRTYCFGYQKDFRSPPAIIIGSEGRGLSELVRKRRDFLAHIPMRGEITPLNASIVAALVMYEASKKVRL